MPAVRGPALLFCPADRPDRYEKAAARADSVILDLEDAVAADAKAYARSALASLPLDPERTIVRVNPAPDLAEDLRALADTAYRTVMLAKTGSAADVRALADYEVIALVETASGVVNVASIAAVPNVVALMWGADDLVASLGGTSSRRPSGAYRDVAVHARSAVLLAAGAAGKVAIDAVHLDIGDLDGLAAEASDAAASGFVATACIHPSQVPVVRAAYRPVEAEVERARAVLAAAVGQHGAFRWQGAMVDGPVLKHAEEVLRRAGAHR
ncbi:HpcH/HpaI aldolase/citrate lyase family protein [Cellulomonas fengjieae]|uniref:HpcH/HpaI aldolase/citrate lyase family protein n=1 Tax=Cellulomonas fengjieae TaxID=2819978 RepID=UPI001AAEFFE3|nr:CoA ester lyase [Cellulomonas fengjieae]MBO3103463.1 CoA ester lyase [Cellulomonas fengjieae]